MPALLGTMVFALRLVGLLVGGDGLGLLPHDLSGDALHADPSGAFQVLSLQALAAFAMGFGWVGLAAFHGTGWSLGTSLLFGVGGGVGMVWLLAVVLRGVHDLNASGNIALQDTIDARGLVYLTIPPSPEAGQVIIVVRGRQRIYAARLADAASGAIPTGAKVRVVDVNADNSVNVVRV